MLGLLRTGDHGPADDAPPAALQPKRYLVHRDAADRLARGARGLFEGYEHACAPRADPSVALCSKQLRGAAGIVLAHRRKLAASGSLRSKRPLVGTAGELDLPLPGGLVGSRGPVARGERI